MTRPVAVVTGGSRGIGRAIVERLAVNHDIAFTYRRDAAAADELLAEVRGTGARAVAIQADLADPTAAGAVVTAAERALGRLSVVIGNAGSASRGRSAVDSSDDEYLRMYRMFVVSNVALMRAAAPSLRAQRGAAVFVTSVATSLLPAGTAPYVAAKAALDAVAVVLAREERAHRVRVNTVAPGLVATDMGDRLTNATSASNTAADLDSRSPLGRVCRPADVAGAVAYLVGPAASYVTGHRLVIDGGGPDTSLLPGSH